MISKSSDVSTRHTEHLSMGLYVQKMMHLSISNKSAHILTSETHGNIDPVPAPVFVATWGRVRQGIQHVVHRIYAAKVRPDQYTST